jgi:hypothetical protein
MGLRLETGDWEEMANDVLRVSCFDLTNRLEAGDWDEMTNDVLRVPCFDLTNGFETRHSRLGTQGS